jgi:sugar phosphate isomerase/epimerase
MPGIKFVHSGLAAPRASLEDDCWMAAGIGADAVELAGPKLDPALERGALTTVLRRHGLRAFAIATVADVTFRDLAGMEALTATIHRWSETARASGADWLVASPGERPDGADARDVLREARETLGRIARVSERYDVGVALCPLGRPRASIRTLRQAIAVVDAVGRPSVALAPDTFEAWAAGSAPDDLKACRPRTLIMLRVADAALDVAAEEARGHHRRPPGDGPLPLATWIAVARVVAPDVALTCAVAPPEGVTAPEPEPWARRLRERTLDAAGAASMPRRR